jgi:CubicO group peptidase (beta-lactamase class C family)
MDMMYVAKGICCGALLVAACGMTAEDMPDDETAAMPQSITVPGWTAYWDYLGVDLDNVASSNRSVGFRPISISAYGTTAVPRYAAVFVGRSGPDWRLQRGTGLSSFQTVFNIQSSQGYKPALLSFDGAESNPVWAAVFVQSSSGIPFTRSALVSGDLDTDGTIQFWLKKARVERLIPTTLSIYGSASAPRYALVVEPNTGNVEWAVGRIAGNIGNVWWMDGQNDTAADFQSRWNAQVSAGNRPSLIDRNDSGHYIEMFRDDSVGPLVGRHELTSASLGAEIEFWKTQGLFPITIQGGGSDSGVRFAAFFAQSELPLTRTFSARGSTAAGDTAITAVDNVMRDFMQRNNVRHASLAAVRGRRLAYARGYTYAEPGYPLADATTSFRMASVSKTVTAMEILRLVDRDVISLTSRVQSILRLKTWTGEVPDSRFGTITIRDLLAHDYPSLSVGGVRQCLLRDGSVGEEVANAFPGASLPVTMLQSVRYSLGRSDIVRPPGGDGCYSNFAYSLLALVVENKRGSFTDGLQRDLFNPLGITRFRIASPNPLAQPANEALYRSFGLWTTPDVNVPGSPLTAGPYGGDNFAATSGAGGMSMAATDMARLLAVLNLRAANPVYLDTTATDGDPATIDQVLGSPSLGFDGAFSDANGTHFFKGGYIDGLQSTVYYTANELSYVLFWARNEVPTSGNGSDNWWPTWPALETALRGANLASRPDLFPTYGMTSFPASP